MIGNEMDSTLVRVYITTAKSSLVENFVRG